MEAATNTAESFIATNELRRRNWTELLIKQFAPVPDRVERNPHYARAAGMRLYDLKRIEGIEATEAFQLARAAAERRQEGARKALETKRTKTKAWAAELAAPTLPPASRAEIEGAAIDWFNTVETWRTGAGSWARSADPEESIRSLCVDFVLDRLENYRARLVRSMAMPAAEAEPLVKAKVLSAVAIAFPWLAQECERRKAEAR